MALVYHNKYPLKLVEIDELLTQSKTYHRDIKIDLDSRKHIEADYLAQILWKLKLTTPRIDRDYVAKLHSGEVTWKTKDSESISLKQDFDFFLLEKLGIVVFEHNWTHINAQSLDLDEHLDDSVLPLLTFTRDLEHILYGNSENSNLVPTTFTIEKEEYERIVPKYFEFEKHTVDIDKSSDEYVVKISGHGWDNASLLNEYFWKKFLTSEDVCNDIEHFYALKVAFSDLIKPPEINLFSVNETGNFDVLFDKILNESFILKCSPQEYKVIEYSRKHFNHQFLDTKTPAETPGVTITLSTIIEKYEQFTVDIFESDDDLVDWYGHFDSRIMIFNISYSTLSALVNSGIYINFTGLSSSRIIDDIFLNAKKYPLLRACLLSDVYSISDNRYNLYLLSNPDFFTFGFNKLISVLEDKYRRNSNQYDSIIDTTLSYICESTVNVAFSNKQEKKLSKLILGLAKKIISRSSGIDGLPNKLFNSLLEHTKKDDFIALVKCIVDEINSNDIYEYREKFELLALFNVLKICEEKLSTREGEEVKIKIQQAIVSKYKNIFNFSLNHVQPMLDKESFYDDLHWKGLKNTDCIDEIIKILPSELDLFKGLSSMNKNNQIYFSKTISNYLQVINNIILLPNVDKLKISTIIKELVIKFGFESKDIDYPILFEPFRQSYKRDYDLWAEVSKNFNIFDDESFNSLLIKIESIAPLSAMLSLSSNTHAEHRRKNITSIIERNDYSNIEEKSIDHIEQAFHLALESNNMNLALISLEKSDVFFANHKFNNNVTVQEMIYKWKTLRYKYDVLSFYYSDLEVIDKEKNILNLDTPKLKKEYKNNPNFKHWTTEIDLFRRYISGLTNIIENPEKASIIFMVLQNERKVQLFTQLIYLSKINHLQSKKGDATEFFSIIKEYENNIEDFSFNNLSLSHKSDYLYGLYLAERYSEVQKLCNELDIIEVSYKPITLTYCKVLQLDGHEIKAKSLIEDYNKFHSVEITDSKLQDEMDKIDESIKDRISSELCFKLRYDAIVSHKTNSELRSIFREIQNKQVPDLSEILSVDFDMSVDTFLYKEALACAKEIRYRAKNLSIEIQKNDENLINDWFVSLFNFRLSWFKLTMCDQKRVGESATPEPKTAGEADGLIIDQRNIPVSLFEALNLNSVDNTVIQKHFDKLAKYELVGISPIFVVSYCYFNDFSKSVDTYISNLKGQDYFDFKRSNTHKIERLEDKQHLVVARESRLRGNKKIEIYHILIDLKLPSDN